jgi:hypothetical protein
MRFIRRNYELIRALGMRNLLRFENGRKIILKREPHLARSEKHRIAVDLGITREARFYKAISYSKLATATMIALIFVVGQVAEPGSAMYFIRERTDDIKEVVVPSLKKQSKEDQEVHKATHDTQEDDNRHNDEDGGGSVLENELEEDDNSGHESGEDTIDDGTSGSSKIEDEKDETSGHGSNSGSGSSKDD